jgi:membrane fusion protein, multidrug efflux system
MIVPSFASDKPAVKSRRRAPLVLGLLMAAVAGVGYLGWQHIAHHPDAAAADLQPPIPVIAATVQEQKFPIVLTSIGNVAALNSATVRSMVTEQIISIDFKEGQDVKKGQILAQLDPASYQSQLDQAEANLARDKAHLENGRIDLGRYVPLAKKGAIPEEEAATQQAKVNEEEAVVKADQAAISYAKTQLGYTKLLAPFDGVAGLRLLDVGNIIHASSSRGDPTEPNALVVINQVQPISVMVALAASGMPEVREALAKGPVEAIALSADGKTELDTGTVGAIDNQGNTTSGTITLKAIFPNTHRTLWPGMFVNVRVVTRVQDNGLTVPLDAIQQGPQGRYVFVVDADHKVAMRPVSVGETLNGEALIGKGLSAGETIVVRGQYRLQPGTVVSLANANDPTAVPNPTPASAGLLP